MQFGLLLRTFAPLIAVIAVGGCGGPALPPLAPVKGKVMVEKDLVTSGQVSLFPLVIDEKLQVPPSTGKIDESGNYEIFTGGKSGAPEGKYKVMVTPSMVPMEGAKGMPKAPFNEKYRQTATTPITIDVVANPQPNAYDLKLTR